MVMLDYKGILGGEDVVWSCWIMRVHLEVMTWCGHVGL